MTAIKPREAKAVIYQGDDLNQLSEHDENVARAKQALDAAEKAAKNASGVRLMGDASGVAAAQKQYDDAKLERDLFADEAEKRGVTVWLHALPRRKWRDLMKEHAARPDNDEDATLGVNMETLPDALLPLSIDPRSSIEGDTDAFLESLSDYDYYDRLFMLAFALNRGSAMADPTQRLLSASSQTSAATSN